MGGWDKKYSSTIVLTTNSVFSQSRQGANVIESQAIRRAFQKAWPIYQVSTCNGLS